MAKLADNKTKQNEASVEGFIDSITDEQKKKDCQVIFKMMEKASKEKPKMWGSSLIGFGYVIIKSPSGREVEWFRIGFAPRKGNFSLYLNGKILQGPLAKKLGKYKTGMGCLYINKLEDIDIKVLQQMIEVSAKTGQH